MSLADPQRAPLRPSTVCPAEKKGLRARGFRIPITKWQFLSHALTVSVKMHRVWRSCWRLRSSATIPQWERSDDAVTPLIGGLYLSQCRETHLLASATKSAYVRNLVYFGVPSAMALGRFRSPNIEPGVGSRVRAIHSHSLPQTRSRIYEAYIQLLSGSNKAQIRQLTALFNCAGATRPAPACDCRMIPVTMIRGHPHWEGATFVVPA